jgi:hypothetical protein
LFLFPVALAVLVAVVAAPLVIDLSVPARATADHGGNVVVQGTVECSIETTVSLEVHVIERLNRSDVASGQFATEVPCDSTPTPWEAVVSADTDAPFRPGFATVIVRAVGFDPENGIFAGVETLGGLHLTRSPR